MKDLLGFETALQMRGVGFWLALILLALFGWSTTSFEWFTVAGDTGERIKADSPLMLSILALFSGLAAILFAGVFVVNGTLRDETHKATEIIHATPTSTPALQNSRLAGVVIATFLSTGAILLGAFIGRWMPWADTEAVSNIGTLGASYGLGYLYALVFGIGINALLLSALFSLIAGISRSRMAVYVSAVVIFLLYTVASSLTSEDIPRAIRAFIDPLGGNALGLDTEFWPPAEQNTRLPPLSGWYGLNRLVYGLLSLGIMAVSLGLFRRGIVARKPGLIAKIFPRRTEDNTSVAVRAPKPVPTRDLPLAAFWTRMRYEYMQTIRSIPFLILSLVMVAFSGLIIWLSTSDIVAERSLPTNSIVADAALGGALLPLLLILIFFSGDVIWRERQAGISELVDSTRVGNLPLMAAKWISIVAVLVTLLLFIAVIGMASVVLFGDVPLEPWTHLANMIGVLPRLIVLSILVMFLQNFLPNRIVGMIGAGAVVAAIIIVVPLLPFYHPLMNFGGISLGGFSEMLGFGDLVSARSTGVYWGGLALVFAVSSMWLWRRGTQTRLTDRLSGLRERVRPLSGTAFAAGLAAFVFGGVGIANAYKTANYRTSAETEQLQVDYETRFADAIDRPYPKIRDVDADVTFRPSNGTASVDGSYVVENTTGAPLEELYISFNENEIKNGAFTVQVAGATLERDDQLDDFGLRRAVFDPPIAPGDRFGVDFQLAVAPPRMADGSPVRLNGTFINNSRLFPTLGLRDEGFLRNPDKRRKYGLPERRLMPVQTDMDARQYNFFEPTSDRVDFSSRFCTEAGQIPMAPGDIVREYERDGLFCRQFRASQPITNFFAFTSGDYEVAKDIYVRSDGSEVELSILHDPQHDYNTALMLDAMKDGLRVMEREFGRYPFAHARIIEFPFGGFAQSFPGTIPFSENLGFVRDPGEMDDDTTIDFATYVTQHELGHQWFGHILLPADVRGFNILSETLTEHAARLAYQETYNVERARLIHDRRNVRDYLMGRAIDPDKEPALIDAEGQSYLFYAKGAWVMWGLSGYLGDDAVNEALRDVLAEFGNQPAPYATTFEIVEALRKHAGSDYQGLITDYWERITFWDLKAENASFDGTTVSFALEIDKLIASEKDGKETSVTEIEGENLDEWIEVAFYADDPSDIGFTNWLSLERVRVKEAKTQHRFVLDGPATHMALDPRRLLIERNYEDNVIELDEPRSKS